MDQAPPHRSDMPIAALISPTNYAAASGADDCVGVGGWPSIFEAASSQIWLLAKYIITMAKGGERDAKWLADSAVLYLSQKKRFGV